MGAGIHVVRGDLLRLCSKGELSGRGLGSLTQGNGFSRRGRHEMESFPR